MSRRNCAISGCKSNSDEHCDLRFFRFPSRDSPSYLKWLSLCKESAESISRTHRAFICSKHFHEKDVGYRRLTKRALPVLFLTASPEDVDAERIRMAKSQAERSEKKRLMNDIVLEWVRRAQHYPISKERDDLLTIASRVRDLLGASVSGVVNGYWLRDFRRSHLVKLMKEDPEKYRNKSLELEQIIADIDPNAKILNEDEIAAFVREEEAKLEENRAKRNLALLATQARKDEEMARIAANKAKECRLVVGPHSKTYKANCKKNTSENPFANYSGHSSDNLMDAESDDSINNIDAAIDIKDSSKNQTVTESQRCRKLKSGGEVPVDEGAKSSRTIQKLGENIPAACARDDARDHQFVPAYRYKKTYSRSKKSGRVTEVVVRTTYSRSKKVHRLETDDSKGHKKFLRSDEDALRYVKALENFVLLESNFRAIGVVSQLEALFRNP